MTEPIQSIPFENATLCADCKMITESKGVACVVCGSLAVVNLRWMIEKKEWKAVQEAGR